MPFLPHIYHHLWFWSSVIQSQSEKVNGKFSKQFTSFTLYTLLSRLVISQHSTPTWDGHHLFIQWIHAVYATLWN